MLRLIFACIALFSPAVAQMVDTTVCDILKAPQSFDGKIVRVKGTALAGFDEFVVKGDCGRDINAIWLSYPEGTRGKAGPVALLQLQLASNSPGQVASSNRVPVKLDKNKDFKQFDSLLSTPAKVSGMCLGCIRYAVNATLVGRLDATANPGAQRDDAGKFISAPGFGSMNRYSARLVLQSVFELSPQEIDYSQAASAAKADSVRELTGDPVAANRRAAAAFPEGSAAAEQLRRAVTAYGEEGEDNGVIVGFGTENELRPDDGGKGDNKSPDGLLLICTFDMDRLKGESLSRAMAHLGTHIADVRDRSTSGAALADLESRAWQTTVLSAVATGQKTLTLPRGHIAWNSAWPAAQRDRLAAESIAAYLAAWLSVN
jgi:hypothetical protein